MSENKNSGPAIRSFSEMFPFADDSDLNEHLRELRAEAFAYGVNSDLRVFPGSIPPSKEAELGEGITPAPKQAQEIIFELLTKHNLKLCEAVNAERRACGEKRIGNAAKLAKRQEHFEKAYYGKLRHSEKGRKVVDLLRAWHGRQIVEQWNKAEGEQLESSIRLVLLSPFLNAVRALDTEFFELLRQAAQMLDTRVRSSAKGQNIGTGDVYLDKWLLEYGFRIAGTPTHTIRELNEQFVSKFHKISDKKLHDKLNELSVPHKHKPSGKASPNYKKAGKKARDAWESW
jgi:hypothetical protein